MNVKLVLLVMGLAAVLLVGCAKAPQQEVDAAKAALEAAKAAEVDRYLADQYNAANDSVNAALTEIETQNSKSALSRNYSKARSLLVAATGMLNSALPLVDSTKAQVKLDVENLLAYTQTELNATKQLIAIAPKGKEGKAALEAIQSELATCETALLEVSPIAEKGDFMSAKDLVNATLQKILALKGEVQQAIDKQTAAKKAR